MPKQDLVHLNLLVDHSGSMMSIRDDSQGGINSMIEEQAKVPGEITVTLYQFDNEYERVFGPVAASDAPTYELVPRGSTALLDAVGKAIADTREYLSSIPEDDRPERVVFVIVTDGHENSSKEFTKDNIKETVQEYSDTHNWEFIYLGANVDAFSEAGGMGIHATTQYHSTGASVRATYAGTSSALASARVGGQNTTVADFMAEEYDTEGDTTSND